MRDLLNFSHYAGAILLLCAVVFTVVSAAHALRRRRETHRLDLVWLVAALAYLQVAPNRPGVFGVIFLAAQAVQPYLLLRLVRKFRDVPALLIIGALALVPCSVVLAFGLPFSMAAVGQTLLPAFIAALMGYAALALVREGMRVLGVTAKRVVFAAIGAACLAVAYATAAVSSWLPALEDVGGDFNIVLVGAGGACYYLAFSTPRRLKAAWQRAEQARYLNRTAQHDAEERGARTAEDLFRAASGGVNNAVTLVALRGPRSAGGEPTVRAATDARLVGIEIPVGPTLIGRATETGEAVSGSVAECGPALAKPLAAAGARALVAPIKSGRHAWGVVLVVQRRGSLFPEDDLQLLAELGRYAAMSLDHADLVREQRERERKAADRRLREVESRMGLMLETITDYAMVVLDHRGRIVTWPPGAEQIFRASAAEMQDEPAAPLFGLTQDEFLAFLADARDRGRAERDGPCCRRDGARFVGSTVIRPLASGVDALDGFVAVVRDVTERRHLEDRVRQTQKMEAIGQLAGGIAHDFNNLLTSILGYSDWLAQDFVGDDPRRLQVAEIQKAGERAAALTRQLLAFSRRQVQEAAAINLSQLIADHLPMLRRVIGGQIEIEGDLDPDVAPILADRGQVEQILINLAVNARDAMAQGGRLRFRTASVWLDERTAGADAGPGAYVMLEVTDSGVGMDAATQGRVFEPFFTTKEFGRGTGLGLATVYGIVKQMDGLITLASQPAQGTTFRLYFPDARGRVPDPSAGRGVARAKDTLLLVEDDDALRALLTQMLERHGYLVIAATDPQSAVVSARAHVGPVHLIITDVLRSGSTGPDLARAMGEVRPDMPILYISSDADGIMPGPGTLPPAGYVLQKPFAPDDLLTRIAQILVPPA